jgi:CRP/FNR family transcriptional regulator
MKVVFGKLKQAVIHNTLASSRLFSGLPAESLRKIADTVVIRRLEKDAYLFRERQRSIGFYIVQQGAINIHRVNAAGKEQIIHVFRTGETFAEATVATETGYPADARAIEPSQVLLVEKTGFLNVLRQDPELALRLLAGMSIRLRTLVEQLEDMKLLDVESRLINWLLKRCPDVTSTQPVRIQLTTTKRVLAGELGTVSETLSRTLAHFRNLGLLAVNGKELTVQDPSKLQAQMKKDLEE